MLEIDFDQPTRQGRFHPNQMSNDEYHKLEGISASGIKSAMAEPQIFLKKDKLMRLGSPAFDMGTALHEALLEPAKFHISKYNLKPADEERLKAMIHNGKEIFNYILKNTANEHSFIIYDEVLEVTRKIRVDAYDEANGIIYDLKSTRYGTAREFNRDAYSLGYHVQGSWYLDTLQKAGYNAKAFKFLCIPSVNPFEPYAVEMMPDLIEDGRGIYSEVIMNILDMKQRKDPRVRFMPMDLPMWRREQLGI